VRVLFLTCHLPYPPHSGGRLRELELLRRLPKDIELQLCAVSKTYLEDVLAAPALEALCQGVKVVPAACENGHPPTQVLKHRSRAAGRFVRAALRRGRVDLVHVEGFYLMQHVPDWCRVPIVLVEQNVEYSLWEQRLRVAGSREEQRRSFLEFRETRAHELAAWRRATICGAVTEDDRTAMLRAMPGLDVRVVPDGADHLPARLDCPAEPQPTVLFVGNYGYEPNVDAARWLCAEIMPRVRERVPAARLVLVGNSPPADLLGLRCDWLDVTGRVERIEPYLDASAVFVAPLRVGGGIKVKMLEALSRGKAIVSTSVGTQGLGSACERCARVADGAEAFAAETTRLLLDTGARRALERRAMAFAHSLPTWDEAAEALVTCYEDALAWVEPRPSQKPYTASSQADG
jgi:polysaccharide biosynthesis protein PslH